MKRTGNHGNFNLRLIWDLSRRDFIARYKGAVFGVVWSLLNPVLMLVVYTFVFSVAFKARWPGFGESKIAFAIIVFSGMIVHGFFAECLNRSPSIISQNAAYVKKVIFPLEILPLVIVLSSLLHFAINFFILVIFCLAIGFKIHAGLILAPVIMFPLLLTTLGMSWVFSSLGVFFKDLTQFVGLLVTLSLFLAPVFFAPESLPEKYRSYLDWNPITMPVLELRKVILFGGALDWGLWCLWMAIGTLVASLGFFWFQKTRTGFADVL